MPKVTVYLSSELHRLATDHGLPITRICQAAIAQALDEDRMTTADRLRQTAKTLQAMADDTDRRAIIWRDKLRAHMTDNQLREIPWLADYLPPGAPPSQEDPNDVD